MQKARSKSAVHKDGGSSGKTGKTGKARKQLTPEQRERKRLADKARRRRIQQAILAEQARARQDHCGSKGCTCGKNDRNCRNCRGGTADSDRCRGQADSPATTVDVAVIIGRHVARQVADAMPGRDVVWASELQDVEPGVARGRVAFSDGSKAIVTLVNGDAVDPLSEYSPLPALAKMALLHARIAKEVSDLVDAHADMESLP